MRDICHALNEARHPATVWVRVWVSERATRCMCVPVSVLVCVCVCLCVGVLKRLENAANDGA